MTVEEGKEGIKEEEKEIEEEDITKELCNVDCNIEKTDDSNTNPTEENCDNVCKRTDKPFHRVLWKSIKLNWLFYITLIVCCVVLSAHTGQHFLLHLLTVIIISLIGYFVHYASHKISFSKLYQGNKNYISENNFLNKCVLHACRFIDYHDKTHHDTDINKLWYNIVFEFINNVVLQGGLIVILVYLSRYLCMSTVMLWALMYATVHNINYLYVKPMTHQNHHKDKHTSYGLDIYDVLFNTKYDPTELEVYNHASINLVLITAAFVYFIYRK